MYPLSPLLRLLFVLPQPPPLPSCTSPGLQPDPASCSAFYHCTGPGSGYKYTCPSGTR